MPEISFPYGKKNIVFNIPDNRFNGELVSHIHHYRAEKSGEVLVDEALARPIDSPPLEVLAKGQKKIVIIASDHTRPVPSKIIIPGMLAAIRRGNPAAEIIILIATGCHRDTSRQELIDKFGGDIVHNEKIVIHNCDSPDMADMGMLPSGGRLIINRLAAEADLIVSEGFIEPHFFAGFSGGRKSLLPGIAGRKTVAYNHNAEFIDSPFSRTGKLEKNPIHEDMIYAAKKVKLAFICNVILNADKEIIYAVAGDCDGAHRKGVDFLMEKCAVKAKPADIVIISNGGYPLDQNIYQAVKGMTAAEATLKKGGVIIMIAKSEDGHGGKEFYKTFAEEKDPDRIYNAFMKTPKEETCPDQWQAQIFARVLRKAKVMYISDVPDNIVTDLHMIPVKSIEEGVKKAEKLLGNPDATITAIPDGVGVMVID